MSYPTRRNALRAIRDSAGALLTSSLPVAAQSQTDDPAPPLPTDLQDSDLPEYFDLVIDVKQLGTAKPTSEEETLAREVLDKAPYDTTPHTVAQYFRDVGKGTYGDRYRPYAGGWPVRYNPVIIEFFKATKLEPLDPGGSGDATFWCAAFANWCIARASSKDGTIREQDLRRGTQNASSGSFRCFGQETKKPKKGDIVVWAVRGSVNGCNIGSGHVAFYDGQEIEDGAIPVIGGNQTDREMKRNAVTRKAIGRTFPRGNRTVEFHSFRTATYLL